MKGMKNVARILVGMCGAFLMALLLQVPAFAATVQVPCNTLSTIGGIQEYINTGGAYASQCNLRLLDQKSDAYSFTIDKEGWVYLKSGCSVNDYTRVTLYYDQACTSEIASATSDKDNVVKAYLAPGTYYYQVERWNGHYYNSEGYDMITTTYIGFIPSENVIKVSKIAYSKNRTYAKVTLALDPAYVSNINNTVGLRKVFGDVPASRLYDNNTWGTSSDDTKIFTRTFKVTQNGTYSVRFTNDVNDEWYVAKATVSGLKGAPKAPVIKKCKIGTKIVSGTAPKNTKVVVKVKNKTYRAKCNKSGKWKVKVKAKLKSGQKVTAYTVNLYGAKSAVKSKFASRK
ncbi:N-acetylmuramoyl-L-alanine amidase [Lachnospiraceae bacterium KM106-2]|nr:N-acetylmuramoyl-L-alanine amidase [Lachnospiraceae bacterium KM106-2]